MSQAVLLFLGVFKDVHVSGASDSDELDVLLQSEGDDPVFLGVFRDFEAFDFLEVVGLGDLLGL